MTRLPTLTARKVIQALESGGFVIDRQRGSHLIMKHLEKRFTIAVPKHGKDLNRNLMKLIIKQAGLTEDEFQALL